MDSFQHFTSMKFRNYKALKKFSVSLNRLNILVGPNNSGKSTILGAFRILSEGMRRAKSRKPELIQIGPSQEWGYRIDLQSLPISTENVFTNYDEDDPAKIDFRLSDGNELQLVFPEVGSCYLISKPSGRPVRTPAAFRTTYPVTVGFVPVLGPVEHEEPLYKLEAARQALLTHRASRNFRNIWHHFPDNFEEFRELIRTTWPGMDIAKPEIHHGGGKPTLHMFCPEERYDREIYWAGFGFQVWCQMLTYALGAKDDSLLVIDEPDIYLHSDLQRQLLSILADLGPDILIATHSTEIITEAEPGDLLVVNKRAQSAKRMKDPSGLQRLFELLGSNLNPTLTQLAKSRRGVFVEGKDFQILSTFAQKLGKPEIARRSDFAVIRVDGFNPDKTEEYSKGIELTLGAKILRAVILDRDYRSDAEVAAITRRLKNSAYFVHIHNRKEIENYLLELQPIERAIRSRIFEQNARTGNDLKFDADVADLLSSLTEKLKSEVSGKFVASLTEYMRKQNPNQARHQIMSEAIGIFEGRWENLEDRLSMVPGKQALAKLNDYLQTEYGISLTPKQIARQFQIKEIPAEIVELVGKLEGFRTETT